MQIDALWQEIQALKWYNNRQ